MKFNDAGFAIAGVVALMLAACESESVHDPAAYESYEIVSAGTTLYEWGDDADPGWIKVLIEESNLGSEGAEIAEIYFPPGYQGEPHPHELEIIYVLEGELDHIVNGESHILKPGMIGVVRARDRVVHRTNSDTGVRTLIVWPLGKEVAGFSGTGMRETDLRN